MRRERVSAGLLAIVSLLTVARCTPVPAPASEAPVSRTAVLTTPVIDSARPDSVVVPFGGVVEVTLHGAGFLPGKPGQNTVTFGGTALRQIAASADGRRIVFVIPDVLSSGGAAPPMTLISGSYSLSVGNDSGTSNAVKIRVYR